MNFDDIEELFKNVKKCPQCGSSEGFWLVPKSEKRFLQCKHCGALIELCEFYQNEAIETEGKFKVSIR